MQIIKEIDSSGPYLQAATLPLSPETNESRQWTFFSALFDNNVKYNERVALDRTSPQCDRLSTGLKYRTWLMFHF